MEKNPTQSLLGTLRFHKTDINAKKIGDDLINIQRNSA